MARYEADREDLLAEATALSRRMEFVAGDEKPVVAGLKSDGRWSIYFDADPAFHFDGQGRLRRAFADGKLYRTQGSTLAELVRRRSDSATHLLRRDLAPAELAAFLNSMRERLQHLAGEIDAGNVHILRNVPPDDGTLLLDLRRLISEVLMNADPLAPAFPGKP